MGLFTDRLRGDGHFDKETQKVRTANGWKPRTIMGLDGKWYSYTEMGAVGDWLAVTANIMDNFDIFRTGKRGHLTTLNSQPCCTRWDTSSVPLSLTSLS